MTWRAGRRSWPGWGGCRVPEPLVGVFLDPGEVSYALAAFDVLLQGRRPSARLASFIGKLRDAGEDAGVSGADSGTGVRVIAPEDDCTRPSRYDLLDSTEAAKILGVSANGVRDLCRRGSLASFRAGGRWLLPAAAVVQRAERRSARR